VVRSDGSRAGPQGCCCDPSPDLTLPQSFGPPPPWPVATASPPCPRRGVLVPSFETETSPGEMGLVLLPVLLYDGFFLNRTSPKIELVSNHANPGGFFSFNRR
jgi:hypothetical protein